MCPNSEAPVTAAPSLMHTGRGVGLGATYKIPVASDAIERITTEITIPIEDTSSEGVRAITIYDGQAVYTVRGDT